MRSTKEPEPSSGVLGFPPILLVPFLSVLLLSGACAPHTLGSPTLMATVAPIVPPTVDRDTSPLPTWTATPSPWPHEPESEPAGPTLTKRPSKTPLPTSTHTMTPLPTATSTPEPTETATPQATPSSHPLTGNLLPNPSFEQSWYHPGGIPELQIPVQWRFEWKEGENPLDSDPWNVYVRPEVRVLSPDFLPPFEHQLYIWDGMRTLKIFKREGAINVRLLQKWRCPRGRMSSRSRCIPT